MIKLRINPYAVMASIHAVKSRVARVWKPLLFVFIVLFNPETHLLPYFPKAKVELHSGAWPHPIRDLELSEHAVYEGETRGSFMHGQGKLILADGTIYEGRFLFSTLPEGTITYPDYSVYEGAIVKWKEVGVGKITYPDGSVQVRGSQM